MSESKNPLNAQIGEFTLIDGALIAVSKVTTEELMSRVPFIGNGTYKSGLIKIAAAFATSYGGSKLGGSWKKAGNIVASGMLIDGVEDMYVNFKRSTGFMAGAGAGNNGGPASADVVM